MRKLLALAVLFSAPFSLLDAQAPAVKVSQSQLTVNGTAVNGKILEMDGKHFVSVEDLAQSLRGTVSYGGDKIALSFQSAVPTPASTPAVAPAIANGRIKGTVTYYFNANYGNRPDVGSDIWLLTGHVDEIPNADYIGGGRDILVVGKTSLSEKIVKYTSADGSGNFDFSDVLPGRYTLVMASNHAKASLLFRKFVFRDVELKSGGTVDVSNDFGISNNGM